MGRCSFNRPKTRWQSCVCEPPSLENSEPDCISFWCKNSHPSKSGVHIAVGTQQRTWFHDFPILFLSEQHQEPRWYNHCWYPARALVRSIRHLHKVCLLIMQLLCGWHCLYFPQELAKLCIPICVLLPKGLAPYGWVPGHNTHSHVGISLCLCFLHLSWGFLHPITCQSTKDDKEK